MPYFHATWRRHLPSIRKHGLGGAAPDRRNFDSVEGLYLAVDPTIALGFLIEAYVDEGENKQLSPPDALQEMCLLVIDDSRIDQRLVEVDPNIERRDLTVLYKGVIDISALPVLAVDDILPKGQPLLHQGVTVSSSFP
jgi:hypothetical protein